MTELHVNKAGRRYEVSLDERPVSVGRASSNDIVLRSERVSRQHCVIEIVDGKTVLRDLDSRHGTKLNGKKIDESPLRPGDRISVGGYEIAFGAGTDAPGAGAPTGGVIDDDLERAVDDERAEALDARERSLAEREQTLAAKAEKLAKEVEAAIESERRTLAETERELTERDESRAREIERLTAEVIEARAALETQQTRAETLAAEAAESGASLEKTKREVRSLTESLAEAESDNESLRKQAGHLSRQLERKSKDLTKTIDRAASLETGLAQAQAAREVLGPRADKAETLEAAGREVVKASEYLTLVRQSVYAIESQWIETDERVQESMEQGQVDAFQAMQREEIAKQLEEAHEERDAAMGDLQDAVARLNDALSVERGTAPRTKRRGGVFSTLFT